MGLPTIPLVPVSATQIIVGSVLGIGLAKGGKNIRYNLLGRISLGWITAPLITFLFSFVALFIVQNVFEQKVQHSNRYVFNRNTITGIQNAGLKTRYLSTVNGRGFENERSLYQELQATGHYSRSELLQIIRITEEYPLVVDTAILAEKGLSKHLSPAQWEALQKLEGRRFSHKWQLAAELATTKAWEPRIGLNTEADKRYNSGLESRLDMLYRSFYKPVK